MNKAHDVQNIRFSGAVMSLRVDGKDYQVDVSKQSERFAKATPEERAHFDVSASGYGIHWPDLDEDLSVDGLIGVKHDTPLDENASDKPPKDFVNTPAQ